MVEGNSDEEATGTFICHCEGECFNFQTILHRPLPCKMTPSDFYQMFARIWSSHPEWVTLGLAQHRAVIVPDDAKLHRNLLRCIAQAAWGTPNFWITPSHGGKLNLIMKMRLIMNTRNASIVEKAKPVGRTL